jgi:hypothetical protein
MDETVSTVSKVLLARKVMLEKEDFLVSKGILEHLVRKGTRVLMAQKVRRVPKELLVIVGCLVSKEMLDLVVLTVVMVETAQKV